MCRATVSPGTHGDGSRPASSTISSRPVIPAEAKSGVTGVSDFTKSVDRLARRIRRRDAECTGSVRVVYGGTTKDMRVDAEVIPWSVINQVAWSADRMHS